MAGTGGRLAGKLYENGNMGAVYSLVSQALVDPSLAKLLLVNETGLTKSGRFNFGKKLTNAVHPYLFHMGPPTQIVREGLEQQSEIDRIQREGGETELYYDEETNQYIRRPVGRRGPLEVGITRDLNDDGRVSAEEAAYFATPVPERPVPERPAPVRRTSNIPAPRPVNPASEMSNVSPVGPAPGVSPVGQPPAGTGARGRALFGEYDPIFSEGLGYRHGGLITGGAGSGMGRKEQSEGIMSIRHKPRQLVG
jgi:hypothetical protein